MSRGPPAGRLSWTRLGAVMGYTRDQAHREQILAAIAGMLQSAMFMAWVRTISGRMKSDISLAPSLTYYTFPFPDPSGPRRKAAEEAAQGVLATRAAPPQASLADLYDPLAMRADLTHATTLWTGPSTPPTAAAATERPPIGCTPSSNTSPR